MKEQSQQGYVDQVPRSSVHAASHRVPVDNPMYPRTEMSVGSQGYHQSARRQWGILFSIGAGGIVLCVCAYMLTASQLRGIADSAHIVDVGAFDVRDAAAQDVAAIAADEARFSDVVTPPRVAASGSAFEEQFSGDLYIEEVALESDSVNDDWWLNSGAFVFRRGDVGYSVESDLPEGSPWIASYREERAEATNDGLKPQNVLRLIKRGLWQDTSQEMYFKVIGYNEADTVERGASNGLLLFSRYLDDDNLYYAGLRVDGHAVIKKKVGGEYHTMYKEPFLDDVYDEVTKSTLIPDDTWIGIRTIVENLDDGSVRLQLYIDIGRTYDWKKVADVIDDGSAFGGVPHSAPGHAGLRTDFMDVSFDHYRLREL